ncbi:Hypothetical protein ETEE_0664 [Edwardsiella anguillarum ET080813]|uniref:Uncharacterized protein n=1 Tax=Edwardsiella anguillarum ET080813 TaxID=667120 RepID=A0A076LF26_9GAMM|nr:Hypothetical protein ETEE_0664 [Edwardsiella anguillarum ET080813]
MIIIIIMMRGMQWPCVRPARFSPAPRDLLSVVDAPPRQIAIRAIAGARRGRDPIRLSFLPLRGFSPGDC